MDDGLSAIYDPKPSVLLLCGDCHQAGITIRSVTDCLIVCVAIEHELMLLHDDRDFEKLAGVLPRLNGRTLSRR